MYGTNSCEIDQEYFFLVWSMFGSDLYSELEILLRLKSIV